LKDIIVLTWKKNTDNFIKLASSTQNPATMIGNWFRYYKYNDAAIQQAMGFEQTYFTIAITSFDGTHFSGRVKDDTNTGGMKETGTITGYIKNGKVAFKKFMPKRSEIIDLAGTRRLSDKMHPTLYYSGSFAFDNNQVDGNWQFSYTVGFLFGFISIPYRPGLGTFSMHIMDKA
jgi:hypothetical protein